MRPKYIIFLILLFCSTISLSVARSLPRPDNNIIAEPINPGRNGRANLRTGSAVGAQEEENSEGVGYKLSIFLGCFAFSAFFTLSAFYVYQYIQGETSPPTSSAGSPPGSSSREASCRGKGSGELDPDFPPVVDDVKDQSYYFDEHQGIWSRSRILTECSLNSPSSDIEGGGANNAHGGMRRRSSQTSSEGTKVEGDLPWFDGENRTSYTN